MRRLLALAVLLLFGGGCASDAQKAQWREVLKDLRGDNMEMRGFGGSAGSGE
jgi:hypothetical protein